MNTNELGFIKKIIDGETAFETVVKDALKYIDDSEDIQGVEYHVGSVDGMRFKLVIEPDERVSCHYSVVTPEYMSYELIYKNKRNKQPI